MKQISEKLWISGQPSDAEMQQAKQAGVVRVINNRPESEEAAQPSSAEEQAAAAGVGMDYVHIPVRSGQITQREVDAFHSALAEAKGPVMAHCKSGTRSLTLYAIGEAQAGRLNTAGIDELGARAGLDLAGAKAWLNAH